MMPPSSSCMSRSTCAARGLISSMLVLLMSAMDAKVSGAPESVWTGNLVCN